MRPARKERSFLIVLEEALQFTLMKRHCACSIEIIEFFNQHHTIIILDSFMIGTRKLISNVHLTLIKLK